MDEKVFVSGTLESGDVMVALKPSDRLSIRIQSTVQALYGAAIEETVERILRERNVCGADVFVNDNGARDYVIQARMLSALDKMKRG